MASIPDNLFTALANVERRQILFDLADEPESVNIDSPPDAIADGGNACIERHHVHLPLLDDYGFINWYPNANAIESGPRFDEIVPVLEVLAAHRKAFAATSL
ncbi:hypothetical protein SAMN04515672_2073 [Natronorubrum texcoconense]|uniref:ArsR family transcriptional regulator n=2 Tax=Natronorubrum texcoconense TaxID=1095776 RepID=A0A1G8Y9B3_9EURY|nr:hypothetical protein SAMN04515672_2073 [Natronorubrum texcoconense]